MLWTLFWRHQMKIIVLNLFNHLNSLMGFKNYLNLKKLQNADIILNHFIHLVTQQNFILFKRLNNLKNIINKIESFCMMKNTGCNITVLQ